MSQRLTATHIIRSVWKRSPINKHKAIEFPFFLTRFLRTQWIGFVSWVTDPGAKNPPFDFVFTWPQKNDKLAVHYSNRLLSQSLTLSAALY